MGFNAIAVLAVSREPASEHWGELASELGVLFSWPPFVQLDKRFPSAVDDCDGENQVAASVASG